MILNFINQVGFPSTYRQKKIGLSVLKSCLFNSKRYLLTCDILVPYYDYYAARFPKIGIFTS